jgi:hypothetical protein
MKGTINHRATKEKAQVADNALYPGSLDKLARMRR